MPLFPGLAFPITPADFADGRVDVTTKGRSRWRAVLKSNAKVGSIGLLGSTTRYRYPPRRRSGYRAIEAAVDEAGGAVPIMAGVGACAPTTPWRLAKDAKAAGAGARLLAAPGPTRCCWTWTRCFNHFTGGGGRKRGLADLHLQQPGRHVFHLQRAELIQRPSAVDGVVAVKNLAPAAGQVVAHLRRSARAVGSRPASSLLGYSADANLRRGRRLRRRRRPPAQRASAVAVPWRRRWRSAARPSPAHAARARRLNARARTAVAAVQGGLAGLRLAYAAANLAGLTQAQPPRPLLPLSEAAQARVAKAVGELELA